MNKLAIFLVLFSYPIISFSFQVPKLDWEISSEKNGVTIYKAEKDEKTGIVPIKFKTILNYPPSRVLAILANAKRKKEWIPQLIYAETIKKISDMERYEYNIYNSPWPFSDRTFLIHLKSHINKEKREIITELRSVDLKEVPVKKDHVRGITYFGKVIVKNSVPGKTYLEMTLLTDFRGSIPTWVVNLVQGTWPKKMVAKINLQLEKKDIIVPKKWLEIDIMPEDNKI